MTAILDGCRKNVNRGQVHRQRPLLAVTWVMAIRKRDCTQHRDECTKWNISLPALVHLVSLSQDLNGFKPLGIRLGPNEMLCAVPNGNYSIIASMTTPTCQDGIMAYQVRYHSSNDAEYRDVTLLSIFRPPQ